MKAGDEFKYRVFYEGKDSKLKVCLLTHGGLDSEVYDISNDITKEEVKRVLRDYIEYRKKYCADALEKCRCCVCALIKHKIDSVHLFDGNFVGYICKRCYEAKTRPQTSGASPASPSSQDSQEASSRHADDQASP